MSEYQSGGGDKSNELKIFPLRNEDLVFSKNRDGILSCGYKVSNALLNATIGMPMSGGGGGKNKGKTNDNNELKSAKIMEDLVIPSSLYCSRHMANDKVFNYKKGKKEKCKKNGNSSSDNESDDNVIEESLYDKLLSLVTSDNKIKYDKKTRKSAERTTTNIKAKKDAKDAKDTTDRPNTPKTPKKEDTENKKNKNKKTKKVRFNL
jgi:hypothetical protein